VVRPAAHEWDEREETPWPIIQEAANIGLYSWEFIANAFGDPTGITFPMVSEELCWGDAGITLSIFGSTQTNTASWSSIQAMSFSTF